MRGPVDPVLASRLLERQREQQAALDRDNQLLEAAKQAEYARLRALASWPEGRRAFDRFVEEQRAHYVGEMVAASTQEAIYRAQGALRVLEHLKANLAQVQDLPQHGVPS